MPAPTDEEVVRRTLADANEFAVLIERYEARLARYILRLGISRAEDREDILQNTFIKTYMNLNSFDPALAFSSWIYRIAHNETMSFFRRSKARPQVELGEEGAALFAEVADESSDTAALAERRLAAGELSWALATLAPRERDVLMLRYFEERSYSEIADILELPLGTVSTLIHRAKRSLHTTLSPRLTP
jgi:RNA polymerase sigma-70 factor (ECF subfamily)